MSLLKIVTIFNSHGFKCDTHSEGLIFQLESESLVVRVSEDWIKEIDNFFKKKIYNYSTDERVLRKRNYAEFLLIRLDPRFYLGGDYTFKSETSEIVEIAPASPEFQLARLDSKEFEQFIPTIQSRIERRISRRKTLISPKNLYIRFEELIPFTRQRTATYKRKGKYISDEFLKRARDRIGACLFHLAYSKGECWEMRESIKSRSTSLTGDAEDDIENELKIPRGSFSGDAVSFYKIAKSSTFPSQTFLSFYHVLEYFFLKVADEEVTQKVKGMINTPGFTVDHSGVNNLISIIKKHEMKSDETELLKMVLRKYVDEGEFMEKIRSIEEKRLDKIYTKDRQVFGERIKISLEVGHALANAAKVIKHIRNGLVHSSDRYERDECLVPFSEAESIVSDYLPLVAFLAESVIISTSELPK